MFTINTIQSDTDSGELAIRVMLEPKNNFTKQAKSVSDDLKLRINRHSVEKVKIKTVKGLIFKDFTAKKPIDIVIPADKINDYPQGIFSAINHPRFNFQYVGLEGSILSNDIELFLNGILAELKSNKTINTFVLRNITNTDIFAKLDKISLPQHIQLSIVYDKEKKDILDQAKKILTTKENIKYILLSKSHSIKENKPTNLNASIPTNDGEKSSFSDNRLCDSGGIEDVIQVLKAFKSNAENQETISKQTDYDKEINSVTNQPFNSTIDDNNTDDEQSGQPSEFESHKTLLNADTSSRISAIVSINANHQTDANSSNRPQIKLISPEIRMEIIKKQLAELEPEINNLRSKIGDLKEENNELYQQNEALKLQNKSLFEENQKIKQTEVYGAIFSSSSGFDEKLFNQLISQAASATTLRQENEKLQKDNESLNIVNNKLQAEKNFFYDENASSISKVEALKQQINKLQEDNEALKTGNSSMAAIINSLKSTEKELEVSRTEVRNLKTQLQVLNELIRREQIKFINSTTSSDSNRNPISNTLPQPIHSSIIIDSDDSDRSVKYPSTAKSYTVEKKRSFDAVADSSFEPPHKRAKFIHNSSSGNTENGNRSSLNSYNTFWNDSSRKPAGQENYSSNQVQLPENLLNQDEQRSSAPIPVAPHLSQIRSKLPTYLPEHETITTQQGSYSLYLPEVAQIRQATQPIYPSHSPFGSGYQSKSKDEHQASFIQGAHSGTNTDPMSSQANSYYSKPNNTR